MANGTIKNGTAVIVPITAPSSPPADYYMKGQAVYDPNTNTVRFTVVATTTGAIAIATPIGNIPAPYRPTNDKTVFVIVRMNNNAIMTAYEGKVGADGDIYEKATNAAMAVFVTGEYSLD